MKMTISSNQTACHSCDLLLTLPELADGEKARCPRCGHLLTRRVAHGPARSLAYAGSALLFLVLSLQFPFLAFEAQGQIQQMTLAQSAIALVQLDHHLLAAILLLFILILPGLLLLLLSTVLIQLKRGDKSSLQRHLTHLLFAVQPWCMAEVFLIGVLVSLIKISSMADIVLGLSFWAYILFTLALTAAIASLDRHQLWHHIDGVPQ